MKQKGRILAAIVLLASSFSLNALDWRFDPYIGVDASWRRSDFKGGFGNNLFAHTYPQGNGYVGFRLNKYMGLEVGYEFARSRSRVSLLTTGDLAAGTPIGAAISPINFNSKGKFKGTHVDLMGFFPLCPEQSPVEVIGSIGVAFLKGTFERRTIAIQGIPVDTNRTLSEHKAVLRLGAGLQYMLTCHLGMRGMVGWENTKRMVIFANDGLPGVFIPEVKPKNSVFYNIGLMLAY